MHGTCDNKKGELLMIMGPRKSKLSDEASLTQKKDRKNFVNNAHKNDPNNAFQLFYCSYLFDNNCNLQILPKDIILVICSSYLGFSFKKAFDGNGVLSWLRNFASLSIEEKENIVGDDPRKPDGKYNGYYFVNPKVQADYTLPKSKSLEILGQETDGTFCSPSCEGFKYFIIDLKIIRLQLSHITMSTMYSPNVYLKSTELIGPTFMGSNSHPSENKWELIENEWKVIHSQLSSTKSYSAIEHGVNTWKCCTSKFYRYFKIAQHTDASSRFGGSLIEYTHQTLLTGIEMYGKAI